MRTRQILRSIDAHLAENSGLMRSIDAHLAESSELMDANREALDLNRAAYERNTDAFEGFREFMHETTLRMNHIFDRHERFLDSLADDMRAEARATRRRMEETSALVQAELHEVREDGEASREALFRLIDEIRGWREGSGPAPA